MLYILDRKMIYFNKSQISGHEQCVLCPQFIFCKAFFFFFTKVSIYDQTRYIILLMYCLLNAHLKNGPNCCSIKYWLCYFPGRQSQSQCHNRHGQCTVLTRSSTWRCQATWRHSQSNKDLPTRVLPSGQI